MKITHAQLNHIDRILDIFSIGRNLMRESGNKSQWINGYPSKELITDDINKKQLFIIYDDDKCSDENNILSETIHAVFAFIIGADKTYAYIEDGNWPNNNPYGTIHRIASDGSVKGILKTAVDYCLTKIPSLRIDTHADNKIMQNAVGKCGFKRAGIIYVEDGSPRIAFQLN